MPNNKDYYVILTGSKNNAGDFLIKYRAKQLFAALRPDRHIIDYDGWNRFDDHTLPVVNQAKALVLMGGPSLRADMYPSIYPLAEDLDAIKVPIVTMGVGWKSPGGTWSDTYDYRLRPSTSKLLQKIAVSGLPTSVRDYHTLNVLQCHGFQEAIMTGCPAYYDLQYLNQPFPPQKMAPKRIAFSLGVSFILSATAEAAMKEQILALRNHFKSAEVEVVFHHSLDAKRYRDSYQTENRNLDKYRAFSQWLERQGLGCVDISGSAENLVNYYSKIDLHVGYRVHAHIFMNSISKPSLLIAEDGRGKATEKVMGGLVVDAFLAYKNTLYKRIKRRILSNADPYVINPHAKNEFIHKIVYEYENEFLALQASRRLIDINYLSMKRFIEHLP